jgi:hypothetical protein
MRVAELIVRNSQGNVRHFGWRQGVTSLAREGIADVWILSGVHLGQVLNV